MKIILDKFFKDFDKVRSMLDELDYEAKINSVDGVQYDGICADVPGYITNYVTHFIEHTFSQVPRNMRLFLRLSKEGAEVPHQAHNDESMGKWALMVYMNRAEHCAGGTEFVDHVNYPMAHGLQNNQALRAWQRDHNTWDKWHVVDTVKMAPNKALLFHANMMHRAAKPSSFGDNAKNGRLLLIAFFDA